MILIQTFFYSVVLALALTVGVGAFVSLVRLVLAEYKSSRNTESSK